MNIVLDIDETLIHSSYNKLSNTKLTLNYGETEKYYVTFRPGLREFLKYIFNKFKSVSIWTAASKSYAQTIMNKVLTPKQKSQLKFFNTRKSIYKGTKPLVKIFNTPVAQSSGILPSNTIIIDDKPDVMFYNPGNGIVIPAWHGDMKDRWLYKLMIILEGILKYDIKTDPNTHYIKLADICS